MIVLDASPLIALTKVERLTLLRDVYSEVIIGPRVRREVVEQGRPVDAPGVRQVEAGLAAGWIDEVQPSDAEEQSTLQLLASTGLGKGEAETLALARSRQLMAVLDDKEARAIAEAMGVRYVGTAGILLEAFVSEYLKYDELEEAVRDLSGVLWLSPDVVAEILKSARRLKR